MQPSFPLICCRLLENKQRSPDTVSLYNRQPHETFPRKNKMTIIASFTRVQTVYHQWRAFMARNLCTDCYESRVLSAHQSSLLDTPFSRSTNTDPVVADYVVCKPSWTVQSVSLMSSRTESNVFISLQASAVRMFAAKYIIRLCFTLQTINEPFFLSR